MKNRDYTSGVILIGAGILFLLRNFGIISFRYLFQFWPVILIITGINLIIEKQPYVAVLTWILFFIIVITLSIMIELEIYIPMIPFPY
ncbi:LiaI-LiaF-like domain-containing protein [Tindallia californiensis]|uniref:LiaI-LiaF-like transmembrane region domain-containing protein n=1 Tax=Tindallia californiensis TaxID=159292 RepID=A0A1H3I433_9FIRM|nr:DUF5668 domain-containing protein [Tindallia californiensis]SDY22447.1 hypothetical protein SAMN05192546_1016 [Tindallia californiensis]